MSHVTAHGPMRGPDYCQEPWIWNVASIIYMERSSKCDKKTAKWNQSVLAGQPIHYLSTFILFAMKYGNIINSCSQGAITEKYNLWGWKWNNKHDSPFVGEIPQGSDTSTVDCIFLCVDMFLEEEEKTCHVLELFCILI